MYLTGPPLQQPSPAGATVSDFTLVYSDETMSMVSVNTFQETNIYKHFFIYLTHFLICLCPLLFYKGGEEVHAAQIQVRRRKFRRWIRS